MFVLGANVALIPGTTTPVSINNINDVRPSNQQYYISNWNARWKEGGNYYIPGALNVRLSRLDVIL